ncbi:hypothetical protein BH23PLA1_BH23PLA1_18390 [soil metagenome]
MPHRLISLFILLFWSLAAASLFVRDILPDLIIGPPPDLRDVAHAEDSPGPTEWIILVEDDRGSSAEGLRSVGAATTETIRQTDGDVTFSSTAWFDSGELLKGTPFQDWGDERLEVISMLVVDEQGNLRMFRSAVRVAGESAELLTMEGRLKQDAIKVDVKGPLMPWPWSRDFPYKARGMVQNTLGPLDRMPGLHVGQRWESQVVSPLTGRVEKVNVEVQRRQMIHWGQEIVTTLEVVTRISGMTARTWVRAEDGLVLRQEVPLLFVTLMLERQPDTEPVSDLVPALEPGMGGRRR